MWQEEDTVLNRDPQAARNLESETLDTGGGCTHEASVDSEPHGTDVPAGGTPAKLSRLKTANPFRSHQELERRR